MYTRSAKYDTVDSLSRIPRDSLKYFDIYMRTSTYQICTIKETITRLLTLHVYTVRKVWYSRLVISNSKGLSEFFFFFFFFFLDLGFTALSRIFHLYRAGRSSKVGENRRTRRKTTWPSVSRTWLSHIWPEPGSNHSGEKPNGLRVNSLIH